MAALAAGDPNALTEWFQLATKPIRGMLIRTFQNRGIWICNDQLDDIVRDCTLELARLAPSWRPDGGAAPWTWAHRRLESFAFGKLGQFADDIDDMIDLTDEAFLTPGLDDVDVTETIRGLGLQHPVVADLIQALSEVTSERDRRIWLEVLYEQSIDNRSPAVTVAAANGLSACNVRKICQRTRVRLIALASASPELQPILNLHVLAA